MVNYSSTRLDKFLFIPGDVVFIGTDTEIIEREVEFWRERLVNPEYTEEQFRLWLLKECPRHKVRINTFYIAKYPVTNGEYREFMRETGHNACESISLDEPDNHPVWGVSTEDIQKYIAWRSEKDGVSLRLPSEFEWEYAAAGPDNNIFPFGNTYNPKKFNTHESGIGHTTPVDFYDNYPSAFGLSDMAGNVEEWTSSLYKPYDGGKFIKDDLVDTCGESYPILKGGSFALGGDLARCARRHGPHPGPAFRYRGFRLAADNLT